MPESLGRYLRRERQMRDVSLEQIARETKISVTVLDALENDHFEALPSPAIVKGFLRAYARIVGLSENSLVLRYESILEERGLSPRAHFSIRQQLPRKPRRLARVVWLLLVVLGLGVGLRLLDREGKPPSEDATEPQGAGRVVYRKNYLRELSTDAPAGTPAHIGAAGPREADMPGDGVHLLLRATAPLSVRVVLDGGDSETIALLPGQPVARHARRGALIETSDPGRLFLDANGRPLAAPVTAGGPVRIVLKAMEEAGGDGALPEVASSIHPLAAGDGGDFSAPSGGLPAD